MLHQETKIGPHNKHKLRRALPPGSLRGPENNLSAAANNGSQYPSRLLHAQKDYDRAARGAEKKLARLNKQAEKIDSMATMLKEDPNLPFGEDEARPGQPPKDNPGLALPVKGYYHRQIEKFVKQTAPAGMESHRKVLQIRYNEEATLMGMIEFESCGRKQDLPREVAERIAGVHNKPAAWDKPLEPAKFYKIKKASEAKR